MTTRGRRSRQVARLRALESLENRDLLAAVPCGAADSDAGEFMLGDILVTVVLMESNGLLNPNTEDWTPASIAAAKSNIEEGLDWWEETLSTITDKQPLRFITDYTYADQPVQTAYEPISQTSNTFSEWIYDFLRVAGYDASGSFSTDIRDFNHAQRVSYGTDWAFTIFVVNDEHDGDGRFASGGSFSRAFAYAGGRFFITPASRPPSTIAHETGHMFWGKDEYYSGASYLDQRGYYNTQNLNGARDNPDPNFVQTPTIMSSGEQPGDPLYEAFVNHASAASTLEMIGWRDSDADGIFDVLDVPHTLTGSGVYDPTSNSYRFVGESRVQTLPNLNSSGNQNDITINEISRAEFRIDGGNWVTAEVIHAHAARLDLSISVPSNFSQIEIRTVDDRTHVTSQIFTGTPSHPSVAGSTGIGGFIWNDTNADGQFDFGEEGLGGWTVQLVDEANQPVMLSGRLEPDDHAAGTDVSAIRTDVSLRSVGPDVTGAVTARLAEHASTGNLVFGYFRTGVNWTTAWTEDRQLRIDFDSPTATVSLDAVADSANDVGRLEIYDADDQLLGRYTTATLAAGEIETMTLSGHGSTIAYAIASAHGGGGLQFDHLDYGTSSVTVSQADGSYVLPDLPEGSYRVSVAAPAGWEPIGAEGNTRLVELAAGVAETRVDFSQRRQDVRWQNPANRFDVNNDLRITPLDALLLINDLNQNGNRILPANSGEGESGPPFIDVNGDGQFTPLDALLVINALNEAASGEGEAPNFSSTASESTEKAEASLGEQHARDSYLPRLENSDPLWELLANDVAHATARPPAHGANGDEIPVVLAISLENPLRADI